jgi:hypothetical protein
LGNFTRTGLTEQEKTDRVRGKEPDVTILSIGSPAGFVSVLHHGLPIEFDELGEYGSEEMGYSVKALD